MSKVAKTTIGLMIITVISKFLGFGRELALTYMYGISQIADIYITSSTIPTILFGSVGIAISTTVIPIFYEIDKNKGRNESIDFINNIFNIVLLISTILAILGCIFAEPLVKIFAVNFTGDKLDMSVEFTRIMIFGIISIGASNIMSCWLQINNNFKVPGLIGIPYNLIIIISILISSIAGIRIMAIGTLIAISSQFIMQYIFAVKYEYKYKLYINYKDPYIKKIVSLIIPVFMGVAVSQINTIVDRTISSTLGDGFITILNSANRLNSFVTGVFILAIVTVIYPLLSKLSNEENKDKFIKSVYQSINSVILLIIPMSIGAIIFAKPIVRIVFERGAFDSKASVMTATALVYYSIGMLGTALREVLNKIFYSLQDTRTPMVNGALSMAMNILMNIILVNILGYIGIALATSISSLICVALLFYNLGKKIEYFEQDKIMKVIIKSMLAALIMGICSYFVYSALKVYLGLGFLKELITLFVSICIGVIVYCIAIVALKVEEMSIITNMIQKRLQIIE